MDLTASDLENSLVRLVPLSEDHREPLRETDAVDYMWASMPAIQRGAGFDAYYDFVLRHGKHNEILAFAVLDPASDKLLGVTAFLNPNRMHRRVEIGYTWINSAMHGKGMYRAIQSLLITRAVMWGARRIGWSIEARNKGAIRAVEALGATHEGVLRNYFRYADGTWVDIVLLSMLREEAKAAVQRLDARIAELASNEA
ncbi:MAG: GNAT family N-acetyltransferase [Henriciella sp.]|nr:GNAT family N-acetyltransferase [Henriciella sp.]